MEITYLLIAIICGIVGYFIGKGTSGSNKNQSYSYESELDACNQKNSQLQNDIASLKSKINQPEKKESKVFTKSIQPIASISDISEFNADIAKTIYGKRVKENDLKIIEGIGPKIEELFKTSGILSWKAMSETSVDGCNKILDKAGERYRIHDPGTWPRQAKLAYEGKWQELKTWQEKLDKGKEK